MERQSFLEKVTGNTITNSAVALATAVSSSYSPLAPLLPVLAGKLATDRYRKRVENAFEEINIALSKYEKKLDDLTDAQYKFMNESITSILFNTNEQKIEYLKRAVFNSLETNELKDDNAIVLSRILRDISVAEIRFLLEIKDYEEVIAHGSDHDISDDRRLHVNSVDNQRMSLLTGLVYLGVLCVIGSGFGGSINYKILPVAYSLIKLIEKSG